MWRLELPASAACAPICYVGVAGTGISVATWGRGRRWIRATEGCAVAASIIFGARCPVAVRCRMLRRRGSCSWGAVRKRALTVAQGRLSGAAADGSADAADR